MHGPIFLKNISLSLLNKGCFKDFSTRIYSGSRIAIIGRNGSGKSCMLNILRQKLLPSGGEVIIPNAMCVGYVEQTINAFNDLSGGQRLDRRLSEVLARSPDMLLLDEPTNHLDRDNRESLMRKLKGYQGMLVIASHDTELLRNCIDILWHIDNNSIHKFIGSYDDYVRKIRQERSSIERELVSLRHDKKDVHNALMKEQKRAAKSKAKGRKSIENRKWPTIVSKAKALRTEQTSGSKKSAISRKKLQLTNQLSDLRLPKIILPKFSLTAESVNASSLLSISCADIGYGADKIVLKNVSLFLGGKERIAICGKNASGKSTLLKAILGQDGIFVTGDWHLPRSNYIGYLDQHYSNLRPELSVIDHVRGLRSDWSEIETRRHLSDFLFRRNEEVTRWPTDLSGGEKARLSLSLIAAKTPKLLLLDEITNNLDLETKEHTIQVLKKYPGAMVVVSHEEDFLHAVGIGHMYTIIDRKVRG